VEYK
jgi:hypothetical protein